MLDPVAYPLRRAARSGGAGPRSGLRVTLHGTGAGLGRGEALALPAAGTETPDEVERALRAIAPRCVGEWPTLRDWLDWLAGELALAPAARSALDAAGFELAARETGVPVAERLAPGSRRRVRVNALLGASDLAETAREAKAAIARGYDVLKVKVGGCAVSEDEARLEAIREIAGSRVGLRIDANGAWSCEEAEERLRRWSRFGLELVEQPVASRDLEGLARLARESPVPVAADEALASVEGREALVRGELAPLAVLKPGVLGGLAPALELARCAARRGVACLVTTTLDGPLGTAAALHLAAATGERSRAHGLAAADWVEVPFGASLRPRCGGLEVVGRPGFGEVAS